MFFLIIILGCVVLSHEGFSPSIIDAKFDAENAIFSVSSAETAIAFLKNHPSDPEAQSQLAFAQMIGIGVEQSLNAAEEVASSLVAVGVPRAHTILALLLRHNITGFDFGEEERNKHSLAHYMVAAISGDPLAQLVVGKHYLRKDDCESSLEYYRRAAKTALRTLSEESVSHLNIVPYIWSEDNPMKGEVQPTLDQVEYIENFARFGDVEACMKAAYLLTSKIPGILQNPTRAAQYLQVAVGANNTEAMVALAKLHISGAIASDYDIAEELLIKAVRYGNMAAHTVIGKIYLEGVGKYPRNLQKAAEHLYKGVLAGDFDAFYSLGKLHAIPEGPGTLEDAAQLWFIPAIAGHVHAAWNIAEYYHSLIQSSYTANDTRVLFQKDKICKEAIPFYRFVALSGEWRLLHNAAYEDYLQGRSSCALLKYLLLSDLGYESAHINAGRLLDASVQNVYKSSVSTTKEGFRIWKQASDDDIPVGHVRLGDHYYYGINVEKDFKKAAFYYKKAYDSNYPHGAFSLAQMAEWGEGMSQNTELALQLYKTAEKFEPDSEAAVMLMIGRIKLFKYLNDTIGIDLYKVDWDTHVKNKLASWDIIVMVILGVFISISFTQRILQNAH